MELINGVPAHILYLHAVVVLVPLTALALLASAIWPSVMRRFGIFLPILGLATLLSVFVAAEAGEWLEERIKETPQVEAHADLGKALWPWIAALFVVTAVVWWLYRRADTAAAVTAETGRAPVGGPGTTLRIAAVVVSLIVGAAALVQTYRVGDSGAVATWKDRMSKVSEPPHEDED